MKTLNRVRLRPLFVLLATLTAIHAGGRSAGAQGRTVHGVVIRGDSHEPLPYSIVAVIGTSIERFSDDSGRFVLTGLPSGTVTVRVRHIGYAPAEVPVVGDTLRVELQRIAVSLAGIRIDADRRCIDPPKRDPTATDPTSVAINQLVENGHQYELLTTKYPFSAKMDQRYGYLDAADHGVITSERLDLIRSDRVWHYQPGRVIEDARIGRVVNVPTIAVFAQDDFLSMHCFWLESATAAGAHDSTAALKIEFHAATRIRDPDLDGTIYLDPKTFAIRRAVLRVAKLNELSDEFDSVTVNTEFTELYPGVPIVTGIDGYNHFTKPSTRDGATRIALVERQRVVSIEFSHGPPGTAQNGRPSNVQLLLDRVVGV